MCSKSNITGVPTKSGSLNTGTHTRKMIKKRERRWPSISQENSPETEPSLNSPEKEPTLPIL